MEMNLKSLKLQPHQKRAFHLEEAGDPELLSDWGGRFVKPVVVDVQVENSGHAFPAQGTVNTVLELSCSRCLQPFTYPVETRFFAILTDSAHQAEFDEAEDELVFYKNGIADLTPLIEAVIVTEVPMTPLCRETCQGLCPVCGIDRNTSTCDCREEALDPRWEKLRQFT